MCDRSFMLKITIQLLAMSCVMASAAEGIAWQDLNADTLAKARAEKKLVFLDLEAVWCHWCHVMDAKTYSDPDVQAALEKGFISAKVDADSRPDLAKRYEDYGWPALVELDPVTLEERAIGSGFQTKEEFLALLAKTDGGKVTTIPNTNKVSQTGTLDEKQRKVLIDKLRNRYDKQETGWGTGSKFVPWNNIEYCIRLDRAGDSGTRQMAEDTLAAGTGLIDPVWGGVYQYSTHGDWVHPHFEKIMQFQAEISRAYALAYQAWKRPADLKAAEDIAGYLNHFLRSPEGAYYVSQDADVVPGEHSEGYFAKSEQERRAIGIPRVDTHVYSRENGMAVCALVAVYQATGKRSYLDDATKAARWIIENRSISGGGFSHDARDPYGPFLADQVSMGRAMLALYQATADKQWLDRSASCANFTIGRFSRVEVAGAGFLTAAQHENVPPPVADLDENIEMARWLNLLGRTTGEQNFIHAAAHAMRYLASDAVIDSIFSFTGGLQLADEEIRNEPVHIGIVGKKDDPAARALFDAAQSHPSSYKIIEWIAKGGNGTNFPSLDRAAAFLCTEKTCSSPKFGAQELSESFSKH